MLREIAKGLDLGAAESAKWTQYRSLIPLEKFAADVRSATQKNTGPLGV